MALDQTENFVRGAVDASINSGDTTISVVDASLFPDPANGGYNLVLWDAGNHPRPDQDPDVEVVRVTGYDTTNNNLTVTRAQEGTSDVSHPSTSQLALTPTAKMFADIDTELGNRVTDNTFTTHEGTADVHHAKTSSASELSDVSADSVSGAHHMKYADADAEAAINNDGDHGSTAPHNYTTSASGLSDVSADSVSDAHHSKTSSASEISDVSADSKSDAHHAKTSSASELSDVSADSVSGAHHIKTATGDVTSANWGDYEIQKNGTDGSGIINFKT